MIKIITLLLLVTSISTHASQSAVAMPDSYSADVATSVLKKGGNAVDAAIAAQFVLAVTLPEAGNIGGGGFMLVRKDGKNDFIDYRETAPLKASRDMYLDENGDVVENLSLFGILAPGVPGTVAGMWLAHQKYGSLPWKELVQPAVDLANKGFIVHPNLAAEIASQIAYLEQNNINVNFKHYFGHAKAGEVFKQPELGKSLQRIRDKGPDGFYRGKTAELLVSFMKKHKGLISHDDLTQYTAISRKPLEKQWGDYQIVTAPPPSSGGIAIIQWLIAYDLLKTAKITHNSTEYVHLLSEIGKRVFADRANYLGDPDFVDVPVNQLIDTDYISKRAKEVNLNNISISENIEPGLKESEDTTHFSIVDKWGNAVSNTTTINISFGSSMVVEGAGFILNDEMDDFSAKPGVANVFGALGGKANEIQPKKRMLSSMVPTIILKQNDISLVTGSPGGTTIITSVYQSILNALEFDMSAQQAVDAPRFHHQLWPKNVIRHHNGLNTQVTKALKEMGYTLDNRHFGDLHMVVSKDGKLQAGSESYGRGKAEVVYH